jgi:hypothetical protein
VTYIPNSIEARDVASLVHMQTNLRLHQKGGPVDPADRSDEIKLSDQVRCAQQHPRNRPLLTPYRASWRSTKNSS